MAGLKASIRSRGPLSRLREDVSSETSPRPMVVRGGDATLNEPVGHCPSAEGIFFPQRPVLKIDGHGYSSTIVHRILHLAGVTSSFDVAELALKVVGEIAISDRQINKLTLKLGQRWRRIGTLARVGTWNNLCRGSRRLQKRRRIWRRYSVDGGRMRTREPAQGRGVHEPHWRETKNAAFHRMQTRRSTKTRNPICPTVSAIKPMWRSW